MEKGGKSGFNYLGVREPALVLLLFNVNVSGMRPRSLLSSQPWKIPAPCVILQVRVPTPLVLWFPPG